MLKFLSLLVLLVAALSATIMPMGLHQVPEGHIGVYWRGGALLDTVTEPGFHTKLPLITTVDFVQVTLQTDTVRDIPCGTSGGSMIYFDKIEVVNRLAAGKAHKTIKAYGPDYDKTWIFDKEVYISEFERLDEELAAALQRDCDNWDTGIDVISIRVTKPRIPASVLRNYERIEEEKTRLMVAAQEQRVTEVQESTLKLQSKAKAEREAEVDMIAANKEATIAKINAEMELTMAKIRIEQQIAEKEGLKQMESLNNDIHLEKERAKADAAKFQIESEADAWDKKLTPAFLQYTLYTSLAANTKIFYGDSIPAIMQPWMSPEAAQDLLLKQSS